MVDSKVVIDCEKLVERAMERRRALLDDAGVTALRVFNGRADNLPGLVVEKLGDVLVVQCHEGQLEATPDTVESLVTCFHQRLNTRAVYRKQFVRDRAHAEPLVQQEHTDPSPWMGTAVDEETRVKEHGITFCIRPYDGFSVGLFLDQRENRQRIRAMSQGKRVLNLFSYTCGFSVAAAMGGAATVSSVDLSKRFLEWGKRNYQANGVDLEGHWFFCSDTFEFYERALRQGRRYDVVVIDPPTFSRRSRKRRGSEKAEKPFVLEEQIESLLRGALSLLDPGGCLLFSTNHRQLTRDRLTEAVQQAAGERSIAHIETPPLPVDFAGDSDYARTLIVRFDG